MKNLENIPKKNIFQVPDGYFDKLPGTIQARIEAGRQPSSEKGYYWYALRYALPVVLFTVIAVFVFSPKADPVDKLLSSVSTEQLEAYLDADSFTVEEILEQYDFDSDSIEAIEQEVFLGFELDVDDIDELDLSDF